MFILSPFDANEPQGLMRRQHKYFISFFYAVKIYDLCILRIVQTLLYLKLMQP